MSRRRTRAAKARRQRKRIVFLLILLAGLFVFRTLYMQGRFPALRTQIAHGRMQVEDLFGGGKPPHIEEDWFEDNMYIVTGMESKEVLASNRNHETVVPASLSKLFTAEYALRVLAPYDVVEVDTGALHMTKPGASSAKLVPGEYAVEDLIAAMLIPSGNDAAYALAAAAGRALFGDDLSSQEAVTRFLDNMRAEMEADGYTDTIITDPSGDAENDRTSVRDLLRISDAVLARPVVDEMVRTGRREIRMPDGYETYWLNTNPLVRTDYNAYNPRVTGVKTGTLNGFHHLIFRYERKEDSYLILLLNEASPNDRELTALAMIEAIETDR